jgi:hypothetical protein
MVIGLNGPARGKFSIRVNMNMERRREFGKAGMKMGIRNT